MLTILQEGQNYSNVSELTNNSAPLNVLYFTATWCSPCKAIAPRVEILSQQYPNINFYKIDVDVFQELYMKEGVDCLPTFLIYKNNSLVGKLEGADPDSLTQLVQTNL
jgi:thiol-disulfide isomerase/thioredoxin